MSTGNLTPDVNLQPSNSVSAALSIRQLVKEALGNIGAEVKDSLVLSYRMEEVKWRVSAATSVMEKIEATETEIRKVRPTPTGYSADGKPIGEPAYTKEQVDTLKKSNEQLTKLNNALDKALINNDFSKVFELSGGK